MSPSGYLKPTPISSDPLTHIEFDVSNNATLFSQNFQYILGNNLKEFDISAHLTSAGPKYVFTNFGNFQN
jgi:hypothetical protein